MISVILQARTSSQRLPQKVLLKILDIPVLSLQLDRIKQSQFVDEIIIATSDLQEDDPIEDIAKKQNCKIYRGNLHNVLDRYYQAATFFSCSNIIRITGDCPLFDSEILDLGITNYLSGNFDYYSNVINPTYPDGLDFEIFNFKTLETTWKLAQTNKEKEHVTFFMLNNLNLFKSGELKSPIDLSSMRWTLDEKEDFEFIKNIYESLYLEKKNFNMSDILKYLKQHPEIALINQKYIRNEQLKK